MDSLDKLLQYYNHSHKDDTFHQVVTHLLQNLDKVDTVSIYEIADLCYSSPSTISRLVKRMGFQNYQDFKTQVSYALRNYRYLNQNTRDVHVIDNKDVIDLYFNFLINNIHALQSAIEYSSIAAVSDCFYQHQNFMIYTCAEVGTEMLQKQLIVSGKNAEVYDNIKGQRESLKDVTPETVIFAVTPDLVELSEMRTILTDAKKNGAIIITICSSVHNAYKKYSDYQIIFEGTKTLMDIYLYTIIINLIKYDYDSRYMDPA